VLTKLTRLLVSHWLMDIGFACVFLAIVLRGERRKSDRFTILRGPFLIVAKARGFILAKPYYDPILSRKDFTDPSVVHRSMASAGQSSSTKRRERHEKIFATLREADFLSREWSSDSL